MDVKDPTLAWYQHKLKADWAGPTEVKPDFGNARILKDGRVVFNIPGNRYRLVVWISESTDDLGSQKMYAIVLSDWR